MHAAGNPNPNPNPNPSPNPNPIPNPNPNQGTPSSYAWSLLVVAHLQAQAPPVLPCLQSDGCWWQHRDAWVEGRGQSTHNGGEVAYG